jgi:hypothetical protein
LAGDILFIERRYGGAVASWAAKTRACWLPLGKNLPFATVDPNDESARAVTRGSMKREIPMYHVATRRTIAGAALAALLAMSTSAQAQTANDFVKALTESWKAFGAEDVTVGAVDGDLSSMTIKDFKATVKDKNTTTTFTFDSTTFEDVALTGGGGYTVGSMVSEGMSLGETDFKMVAGSFEITNYESPPLETIKKMVAAKQVAAKYDAVSFGDLEISGEDNFAMTIDSITLNAKTWKDYTPTDIDFELAGANFDLPTDSDDDTVKELRAMGYENVNMTFRTAGTWDPATAKLTMPTFDFAFADMGTLSLALGFGGFTQEVYEKLTGIDMEKEPEKAMEIVQALDLTNAKIRFENESIVEKVIEKQAKDAGQSPADFTAQISGALPLMLAAIGNKDFEKKVAAAAQAFLKSPKSISAVVEPKNPIPLAQVVGTAMMAPQQLPTVLGVELKAND